MQTNRFSNHIGILELKASFGASFIWLICLIYFTQVPFLYLSHSLSALAKTIALKKKIVFVWWKFGKFMILGFWV